MRTYIKEFPPPSEKAIGRELTGETMPLKLAPLGQNMKIVKILADEKTKKHLADLGLTIGSEIVVFSSNGGSLVCIVRDVKLAIDFGLASHIFVA